MTKRKRPRRRKDRKKRMETFQQFKSRRSKMADEKTEVPEERAEIPEPIEGPVKPFPEKPDYGPGPTIYADPPAEPQFIPPDPRDYALREQIVPAPPQLTPAQTRAAHQQIAAFAIGAVNAMEEYLQVKRRADTHAEANVAAAAHRLYRAVLVMQMEAER